MKTFPSLASNWAYICAQFLEWKVFLNLSMCFPLLHFNLSFVHFSIITQYRYFNWDDLIETVVVHHLNIWFECFMSMLVMPSELRSLGPGWSHSNTFPDIISSLRNFLLPQPIWCARIYSTKFLEVSIECSILHFLDIFCLSKQRFRLHLQNLNTCTFTIIFYNTWISYSHRLHCVSWHHYTVNWIMLQLGTSLTWNSVFRKMLMNMYLEGVFTSRSFIFKHAWALM